MARTVDARKIIVVDDEPHHIDWVVEYIESLGYKVRQVTNLNEALQELDAPVCRAVIIDLSIPVLEPLTNEVTKAGSVYARFPGLYAARYARNKGYRDRQTIVYSVHQDAEILAEADRLRCTYLPKGRPRTFKTELAAVLKYDPTQQ